MEEETLRDVIYFEPDPSHRAEVDGMNLKQMHRRVDEVYALLQQLPRFDHLTPKERLLVNGIYVFFEQGASVVRRGKRVHRIVRIGTHKKDGVFWAVFVNTMDA